MSDIGDPALPTLGSTAVTDLDPDSALLDDHREGTLMLPLHAMFNSKPNTPTARSAASSRAASPEPPAHQNSWPLTSRSEPGPAPHLLHPKAKSSSMPFHNLGGATDWEEPSLESVGARTNGSIDSERMVPTPPLSSSPAQFPGGRDGPTPRAKRVRAKSTVDPFYGRAGSPPPVSLKGRSLWSTHGEVRGTGLLGTEVARTLCLFIMGVRSAPVLQGILASVGARLEATCGGDAKCGDITPGSEAGRGCQRQCKSYLDHLVNVKAPTEAKSVDRTVREGVQWSEDAVSKHNNAEDHGKSFEEVADGVVLSHERFAEHAKAYAAVIVKEMALPSSYKTIPPVTEFQGGRAGPTYFANGIWLQLCDPGGDDYDSGKDTLKASALFQRHVHLHSAGPTAFTMQCKITYSGWTLIARAASPHNAYAQGLVMGMYGGLEPPADERIRYLPECSGKEEVRPRSEFIHFSGVLARWIAGLDQDKYKKYIKAGAIPPGEAISTEPSPVEAAVMAAWVNVLLIRLPQYAKRLEDMEDISLDLLSQDMHQHGVAMRLLGKLYLLLDKGCSDLRKTVMSEMVARVLKNRVNSALRSRRHPLETEAILDSVSQLRDELSTAFTDCSYFHDIVAKFFGGDAMRKPPKTWRSKSLEDVICRPQDVIARVLILLGACASNVMVWNAHVNNLAAASPNMLEFFVHADNNDSLALYLNHSTHIGTSSVPPRRRDTAAGRAMVAAAGAHRMSYRGSLGGVLTMEAAKRGSERSSLGCFAMWGERICERALMHVDYIHELPIGLQNIVESGRGGIIERWREVIWQMHAALLRTQAMISAEVQQRKTRTIRVSLKKEKAKGTRRRAGTIGGEAPGGPDGDAGDVIALEELNEDEIASAEGGRTRALTDVERAAARTQRSGGVKIRNGLDVGVVDVPLDVILESLVIPGFIDWTSETERLADMLRMLHSQYTSGRLRLFCYGVLSEVASRHPELCEEVEVTIGTVGAQGDWVDERRALGGIVGMHLPNTCQGDEKVACSVLASASRVNLSHSGMNFDNVLPRLHQARCTVTHLVLHGCGLDVSHARTLSSVLTQRECRVTHLDLNSNDDIGDDGAELLAMPLALATCSVEDLSMVACGLHAEGLRVLILSLKRNRSIRTMNLGFNYAKHESVGVALFDSLRINKSLKKLVMYECWMGLPLAVAMGKVLGTNTGLEALHLRGNNFGDMGAKAVFDALGKNSTLRILDLRRNGLSKDGRDGGALDQALASNVTIETIHLNGPPLDIRGLREAGGMVSYVKKGIRDFECCAIVAALRAVKEGGVAGGELYLAYNYISALSIPPIVELSRLKRVKRLDLRSNKLGDAGCTQLAALLKEGMPAENGDGDQDNGPALSDAVPCALTALHLGSNMILRDGCLALAEAVRVNTTLKTLDISGNRIGDVGSDAIAKAMCGNSTLVYLDLSFNSIRSDGVIAVATMLEVNQSLERIEIEGADCTDDERLLLHVNRMKEKHGKMCTVVDDGRLGIRRPGLAGPAMTTSFGNLGHLLQSGAPG